MRLEFIIDTDGDVQTEVLDREGENCANALVVAQALGTVTSDERTGPDCDEVHEGMGGSDLL